jgi:aminopeptidase N
MYNKGGFVLHMLRTIARALKQDPQAGDELFKTALQDFISEQFLDHPSNLDMQLSFGRTYGFDLRWFFEQWVYGTGIPKVEFSHEIAQGADGQLLLRGRLRQRDTDFKFPVAITLHYGRGKDAQAPYFYTWAQQADQLFEVPLPSRPDSVTVNDDLGLLAVIETVPWQRAAGERGTEHAGQ